MIVDWSLIFTLWKFGYWEREKLESGLNKNRRENTERQNKERTLENKTENHWALDAEGQNHNPLILTLGSGLSYCPRPSRLPVTSFLISANCILITHPTCLRQTESVFGPCNKKPNEVRLINLASVLKSHNSLTKLTHRTFRRKNNDKNFSYVHDRNNLKQMWGSFLLSFYQLILCTRYRFWSILWLEVV